MNFMPIVLMNVILLAITVLLAVANRLLLSYGRCKVTLQKGGESEQFEVQGGESLLSSLIAHKVDISSSCGGKGSCGYCKVKVLEGGGQILPTETLFMSRQEVREGMRLACQVKIKNDIAISIPDFLTVVRQMVRGKKFDPRKRWKVTIR